MCIWKLSIFLTFFEIIEFSKYYKIFRVRWIPHVLSSWDFSCELLARIEKIISKILEYFGIGLFKLNFKYIWGWLLHVVRFWNIFLTLWHQLKTFPEKSWCTLKLGWLYWILKIFMGYWGEFYMHWRVETLCVPLWHQLKSLSAKTGRIFKIGWFCWILKIFRDSLGEFQIRWGVERSLRSFQGCTRLFFVIK